jgi:hypothetical protein
MPGNALIGGNLERSERIYPSDWPCSYCGHQKKNHGPLVSGRLFENACLMKSNNNLMFGSPWLDNCNEFVPVDNLTFVEREADVRKIS